MAELFLGIDVGSTTIKLVLLNAEHEVLSHQYLRARGQPRQALLDGYADLERRYDLSDLAGVGLSGSGGEAIAALIGGHHVNELVAQTRAVQEYHPEARTVIEIGGQDSKFLSLERDDESGRVLLARLRHEHALRRGHRRVPRPAGRAAGHRASTASSARSRSSPRARRASPAAARVFAKSDMIHLQQQGTPLPDILAGPLPRARAQLPRRHRQGEDVHAADPLPGRRRVQPGGGARLRVAAGARARPAHRARSTTG